MQYSSFTTGGESCCKKHNPTVTQQAMGNVFIKSNYQNEVGDFFLNWYKSLSISGTIRVFWIEATLEDLFKVSDEFKNKHFSSFLKRYFIEHQNILHWSVCEIWTGFKVRESWQGFIEICNMFKIKNILGRLACTVLWKARTFLEGWGMSKHRREYCKAVVSSLECWYLLWKVRNRIGEIC